MLREAEIGDLKDMYTKIKISVYIILTAVLLAGCSYQRQVTLPPVGLPEGIYSVPHSNHYGSAKVGVFAFGEPSHAEGAGKVAARLLCQELQQKRVFEEVMQLPDITNMTMGNLINFARMKRYDLIITGKLLYYFEGSSLEPSSVTQEIQVVEVSGGEPRLLWYARAAETARPILAADYIIAKEEGSPAPSTAVLMRRNAEKFCNMLLDLRPLAVQPTYPSEGTTPLHRE